MTGPRRRFFFGEWRDASAPLTAAEAVELMRLADARREAMGRYPLDKVLSLLERVAARWSDPGYAPRRELLELLPVETGFTRPMLELAMDELKWVFSRETLLKKVRTELGAAPRRGDFAFDPATSTARQWHPVGTLLHVLAGNVFIGAAGSLAEGLITGNVNILKMSSGEMLFLPRLMETFLECDTDRVVSRSMAVIDYSSSQKDVMEALKSRTDGIVVWGGEDAVRGYRDGLPARTRLVVFGPKLSLALVTREGLKRRNADAVGASLARELAIWDQAACTAPQVCYVESREGASKVAEALARALEREETALPSGVADLHTAVEIQKLRSVYEIAESRGEAKLYSSKNGVDWTVFLDERDFVLEPSPLHRTIRVIPYERIDDVLEQAGTLRGYVQTVGLSAGVSEQLSVSARFAEAGALRVTDLGSMSGGESDDPHDGAYDLPQLMRLVVTRVELPAGAHPADLIPWNERKEHLDALLRDLLIQARRSPFYAERLKGLEIDRLEDLGKLPILTRADMEAQMSPYGTGLATRGQVGSGGGYVTRSGGTTGTPKFSIYDGADWRELAQGGVRLFRAMGLEPADRVANCMLAGDLYGSFVSFDHINSALGVTTFAFAGAVTAENFVDAWRKFRLNAIQGVPSSIVPMLREAKRLEPELTLEKFMFAGAPLSREDGRWLRETLGIRRLASVIGATDGAQFAFQTQDLEGTALHSTVDEYNWVEIVDESGREAPVGQVGRILITSLRKGAFPLIRYEIGDQGRWVEERGARGTAGRRFEYLGRADNILIVGLCNLNYLDFRRAIEELPVSELQLAARTEAGLDYLVVRFEAEARDDAERKTLEVKVRDAILKRVARFEHHLSDGSLGRMDVEGHVPLSLPRNSRSAKIRQLVDER